MHVFFKAHARLQAYREHVVQLLKVATSSTCVASSDLLDRFFSISNRKGYRRCCVFEEISGAGVARGVE